MMSLHAIRIKLRKVVMILRERQQESVKLREQWLEEMAIKNAVADGDMDAQKILKTMLRKMHTQAMDSKLNRITNGERTGLDYIEVPKGEWFISRKNGELYHYHLGVFEAYAMNKDKQGE